MATDGIESDGPSLREQMLKNRKIPSVVRPEEGDDAIPRKIPMDPIKITETEPEAKTPDTSKIDPEIFPTREVSFDFPGMGLLIQKYHDIITEGALIIFVIDTRWEWGNYYLPTIEADGCSKPFQCTIDNEAMILQYFNVKFTDLKHRRTYIIMVRKKVEKR